MKNARKLASSLIALLVSLVLISTGQLSAHAAESNTLNASNLVPVLITVDDKIQVEALIAENQVENYKKSLLNPDFRSSEFAKIRNATTKKHMETYLRSVMSIVPHTPGTKVYYMSKTEVLRILDRLDKNTGWVKYISNPLSNALIAKASQILARSSVPGVIASTLAWTLSDLAARQESWWKDSANMILRGQIRGVKMTLIPNNGGYPVMYRIIERY